MKKKAVLALTLAGLVALQLPMTAMADTVHTHDGVTVTSADDNQDVTATAGHVAIEVDGQNCTVKKVTASRNSAIKASNDARIEADSATNEYVLSSTVRALSGAEVTVNGAVTNKTTGGAISADGGTVKAGSATNGEEGKSGSATVKASGIGATVTIEAKDGVEGATGAVTNNGDYYAIQAENGATVTAGSATNNGIEATVNAISAAQVMIGGNATNNGNGSYTGSVVTADGAGTKVSVDGNVVQNGESAKIGCYAVEVSNGAEVDAGSIVSNCSNGVALYVEKSGTVKVDGNIEGNYTIWLKEITAPTTIAVSGEVKLTNPDDYKKAVSECDQSDLSNVELSVWGINGKVADGVNVNYIVKDSDNTASYKNMSFDSSQVETVEINGKTYYTAKQGTITVTVKSGYELTSTKGITGSGNVYTVEIPEGGYVTLEAVMAAVQAAEAEEKKATVTGSEGSAVIGGQWNVGPGGYWTYRNNGIFKDTWGYITLANGKTGWFWFDKNGVMATGWKKINDKWYYFNEANDGTQGMMLVNTTTPDGYKVGADGAMIQ